MTFKEFGFHPLVIEGIESIGYSEATPIQEQAIPVITQGRDLIASAQTGTGKTAAFLLPIIDKITKNGHSKTIQALVIVPTRELAVQIDQHVDGMSYYTHVGSIAIYGGTGGAVFSREQQAIKEGADMLICTPGRLIAHINMGYVSFDDLKYLVLDEADRMLDMGFHDDIMKIISNLPKKRQTLLFSATMPDGIKELSSKILNDPFEIALSLSKPPENISQQAYVVYAKQKPAVVRDIISRHKGATILVFCSTKSATKDLAHLLRKSRISAGEIHSDLEQDSREETLQKFKSRTLKVLVATDILSRGIDIEDIDIVINYDVPHDAEDYIHRVGRTARAAASGMAVTLINEKEQYKFKCIEDLLGHEVEKLPVPKELGPAPDYKPGKKSFSGPKNFSRGKKDSSGRSDSGSKRNSGGKRDFHRKKS